MDGRARAAPSQGRSPARLRVAAVAALCVAVVAACEKETSGAPPRARGVDRFEVNGPFPEGDAIPATYTCDGENASPRLAWPPADDAGEYVVVLSDPDAPGGTFIHWVVFGIPGDATGLPEGRVPEAAREGVNDFGDGGYGGPCPPEGDDPHRYAFTVYRLRSGAALDVEGGASPQEVFDAVECCIEATGKLTGTYGR